MNYSELEERRRRDRVDFFFWALLALAFFVGSGIRFLCVRETPANAARGEGHAQ